MSKEKIQPFFDLIQNHPELQQKVRAARQENGQNLQGMAAALSVLSTEAGLPFTSEEFLAAISQARELTDSDLQGISGGVHNGCIPCFG